MTSTVLLNFQQVYEETIEDMTKELLHLPRHYVDLSNDQRRLVDDLLDAGYQQAIEDALDPTVLEETSELAKEMSNQLASFSGLIESFLPSRN